MINQKCAGFFDPSRFYSLVSGYQPIGLLRLGIHVGLKIDNTKHSSVIIQDTSNLYSNGDLRYLSSPLRYEAKIDFFRLTL
jgi:hypothetical protein